MKNFLKSLVVTILTFEAKLLLRRAKPQIIAVTGSVGKTSTKDAIYQVIRGQVAARKSEKSYNSELGVPLTVLGLENAWHNPVLWLKNIIDGLFHALFPINYPAVLVLEMGVDRPGDMKRLTSWIKPDIVVLTRLPNIPAHVEHFGSPEAIIAEKLILLNALHDKGVLIYNRDDEKAEAAAREIRQKTIGFGRYAPADFTASGDNVLYQDSVPIGMSFLIESEKDKGEFLVTGALGVQYAYNFAAAGAVAEHFGISLQECADRLSHHTPAPGRMRLIDGIKETVIIDDSYNSSPVAALQALSTLGELRGVNRRIAVLGDMLELGRYSVEAHKQLGKQAAETSDILITVGMRAREIAEGAEKAGMKPEQIHQYDEAVLAGRELQNLLQPGDTILIKGSQGMRMERIVVEVMKEPDRAEELLVRQSQVWQTI
ncbi:hypothetical protein A2392_00985 [Candidatus Kaiserbacteria bacterium RIFOXYB1_FULL_46_14]|uniref:UDP-N-acetylmuramoyl-tripeptide--D-alanyl-D-alanine ligase n=1 Tax=Candidatus Kaiserbacteria bacterium RIFOXYB1_FULL_46_14 TaxID=1798531 RepID=A0A1F6FJJ0_9BACT|nr:MAG: hypothetical protein A2392_00985 [Candidatus Kaiserbacteria bacterium RIFOXYB1_FULL_46_14]